MVLTNFECWALSGNNQTHEERLSTRSNVDLFNPRAVMRTCGPTLQSIDGDPVKSVSHISSNGYYGFSYINAAHSVADAAEHNNNVAGCNNGNGNCVNDVFDGGLNSPRFTTDNEMTVDNDWDGAGVGGQATMFRNKMSASRKKRVFVDSDDLISMSVDDGNVHIEAKKCRFDNNPNHDDDIEAQYCNDFFRMSSQQIGTQACLMDTEDHQQMQSYQQNANSLPSMMTSLQQQQSPAAASHLEQVDAVAVSSSPSIENRNTFHKNENQMPSNNIIAKSRLVRMRRRGDDDDDGGGDVDDDQNISILNHSECTFLKNDNSITANISTTNFVSGSGCASPSSVPSSTQQQQHQHQQQSINEENKRAMKRNAADVTVIDCRHHCNATTKINKSKHNQQQINKFCESDNKNGIPKTALPANDDCWQQQQQQQSKPNHNRNDNREMIIETKANNNNDLEFKEFNNNNNNCNYDGSSQTNSDQSNNQQAIVSLETMFSTIHGGGYGHMRRHVFAAAADHNDEHYSEEF